MMGIRAAYHSSPPERGDETLKGPNMIGNYWEAEGGRYGSDGGLNDEQRACISFFSGRYIPPIGILQYDSVIGY